MYAILLLKNITMNTVSLVILFLIQTPIKEFFMLFFQKLRTLHRRFTVSAAAVIRDRDHIQSV